MVPVRFCGRTAELKEIFSTRYELRPDVRGTPLEVSHNHGRAQNNVLLV